MLDDGSLTRNGTVGASTYIYEALELRDKERPWRKEFPQGYCQCRILLPPKSLHGGWDQAGIDRVMIELDGTPNKSRLGANATLAVSGRGRQRSVYGQPLYRYLGYLWPGRFPPFMNVLNGGKHADNIVDIQSYDSTRRPLSLGCCSDVCRSVPGSRPS